MPKSKANGIVSGCASAMLAIFIAAAVIHFNDWMKNHAESVTEIMYVSGAIAVFCVIAWLVMKESTNQSSPSSLPATINAPISVSVSPNFSQTASQTPSPAAHATDTISVSQRPTKPEIPLLLAIDATRQPLDCIGQIIKKSNTGTLGAVLWVENPPAAEGQRAKDATGVAAVICFTSDLGFTGRVDRAYWLDHFENQIAIEVGQTKGIVLGIAHPLFWKFYSNKRTVRPNPRPTMQQIRNMAERLSVPLESEMLAFQTSLEAVITIISVKTGYTIAKAAFRIVREENPSLFRIEEIVLPV
jgi:hypothetical protein